MASMVNMVGAGLSYSPRPTPSMEALKTGRGGKGIGPQFHYYSPGTVKRVVVVRAETINPQIRKTEEKVVDSVQISEVAKPVTAYCRCWRSGTFPLCDGSHMKHNKATGDNVGPLLLKK